MSQRVVAEPRPLTSPSAMFMLKRTPTTADGRVVDRLQESNRVYKPFKAPTVLVSTERVQPARKRKRVSYKESQGDENDSDSDDARKKKKKKDKDRDATFNEEELKAAIKTFPVYKPKPFEMTVRRFSMPTMTNKSGEVVPLVSTGASLGIRPQAKIIPRPLHDPMQDHAIVLYDPTIDDRETDEEKKVREKEEAKERAVKEAQEKTAGMYNPHKSLRTLLGEGKDKKETIPKVPVVIDPRLSKVLRPHQIEGVKVIVNYLSLVDAHVWVRSFCINAQQECWSTINTVALWPMRWGLEKPFSASLFFGL